MKTAALFLLFFPMLSLNAQLVNKQFNQDKKNKLYNTESEIVALENTVSIVVKVIYNARPDGYHITYTKSFIGSSIAKVESQMNQSMDSLTRAVSKLQISKKDVVVDIISLDPIFDFDRNDSTFNTPIGYKITENITFDIKSIETIGPLSKKCLEFGIYDLINAQAYLLNSKPIYDTLSDKTVEVLNRKKKLCTEIGWPLADGKVSFTKFTDVLYPSERYLGSYTTNAGLYKHHVSQNSTVKMERRLEVDNYYDLNLKDADFVFNSDETDPVIQFYYQLNYTYTKKDTEKELREKIKLEEEKKHQQQFFIIDKTGNLKKIDLGH